MASQCDCLEQHSSSNTHEWFTNLHNSGCSRPAVAATQRHCLQDKSRLFSKTRLEEQLCIKSRLFSKTRLGEQLCIAYFSCRLHPTNAPTGNIFWLVKASGQNTDSLLQMKTPRLSCLVIPTHHCLAVVQLPCLSAHRHILTSRKMCSYSSLGKQRPMLTSKHGIDLTPNIIPAATAFPAALA